MNRTNIHVFFSIRFRIHTMYVIKDGFKVHGKCISTFTQGHNEETMIIAYVI